MSEIRIGKVDIKNFLIIRGASIDFSKQGLVGVMGPNGVGKSSLILETLEYGLFGVSERWGSERDKVVNRFAGAGCELHIPLEIDYGDHSTTAVVEAYRKHPKHKDEVFLHIDGENKSGRTNAHTWEKVARLLDMDHTSFCNSVVFGQSQAQYFSGLTDSQQKGIVEKLLGMSWIPRAYELVNEEHSQVDKALDTLAGKHGELKQKLQEVEEQVVFYKGKQAQFEVDRANKLKDLEDSFGVPEDISALEVIVKDKESEVATGEVLLTSYGPLNEKIKEFDLTIRELETNAKTKMGELGKIEIQIEKIKKIKIAGGDVRCDACGQTVTITSKNMFLEHLGEDIKAKTQELNDYLESIKSNQEARKPLLEERDKLVKLEQSHRATLQMLDKRRADLSQAKIRNAKVEAQNAGIKKRIEEVQAEANTFQESIDRWEAKKQELAVEFNELVSQYKTQEKAEKYCEALVELYSNRGFKSFVIESVLPDMDRFAATYSRAFGDKYEITFSPQSATKKGEIREKFNVGVMNRFGADEYEGNSSGEKRAIDSIVMFVMGDLAASRLNNRMSLLILDDVFEKLDENTCDSVIRILKMMVTPKGSRDEEYQDLPERESVFVLTHLEQFKESFQNKIRVGRNENGETTIIGE